ncbi:MAG: hypothetical protein IOC39_26820 [Burkholderia sp.]|jgi:aminobenzoyl-glutamate utilization protein B|uniref:hypothetical protein n=1 Tax=Burkholderia TaxID=32008 RepID=UPI001CF38A0C|nr:MULTISPECIES: hypothetical protein [Burkholderia]MCA3781017.1 hypothetical protein [Burkholderia sp.]MCA3787174.1 hypothetical protein [Burkholderia sp.]MCA3796869.1 hypothetical protein [Burkholderia sp.]MCA3806587.1 hypothetical protein [Burkholderia sp.]MCA3810509.1 hypothetical protein [Burkholderia sp.]
MQRTNYSADDVSRVTPTAPCHANCDAFGMPPHSWQWVAQGKTALAHKWMMLAAKTMAATAIDLLGTPDTLASAKTELLARRGGWPYVCPIPDDVALPFRR